MPINESATILGDAGKILTDLQYGISLIRRSRVTSGREPIIKSIADELDADTSLFEEKFSERYKTAKEVEKMGKELIKQTSRNSSSSFRKET